VPDGLYAALDQIMYVFPRMLSLKFVSDASHSRFVVGDTSGLNHCALFPSSSQTSVPVAIRTLFHTSLWLALWLYLRFYGHIYQLNTSFTSKDPSIAPPTLIAALLAHCLCYVQEKRRRNTIHATWIDVVRTYAEIGGAGGAS